MAALDNRVLAWDVLMFIAILLLVLALVPPLFSRRVIRRKTWHTLLLSLLVFSIGEVLLVGHQQDPNFGGDLCLVQIAVIYSTPPLYVQLLFLIECLS
jgi:glucose uptake protein GlcU